MESPSKDGQVHVSGALMGGHCYLCFGWDGIARRFRCQNSWGTSWGVDGEFSIAEHDMARLLSEQGEAVGIVERA
jgi:C1A family cysteine protease